MKEIIVIGAGWAGCAAAVQAKKSGSRVVLLERSDMLLGTGLVGGIMKNNGRFTASEEMISMGGGELFTVIDANLRHKNINFPGHDHADLYDIGKIEGAVYRFLQDMDIEIKLQCRIVKVQKSFDAITSVTDSKGVSYKGDVFIDTTGTAGPISNCSKYGNGCAMCILRCPSFGGRMSIANLAGVEEKQGRTASGSIGSMSGSCKLYKESINPKIIAQLNQDGVVVIPISESLREDHLSLKCCQQYALPEFKDNIILLDTGHGKLMTPYYNLDCLHQIPGFENARYEDPYAGGKGNSMRFFAVPPRDNTLKVKGVDNLFCAGEKAGLLVGHTEAIITGVLAGYNSAKYAKNERLLTLSEKLACGDAISFVNEELQTEKGLSKKYTFSGSCYFDRMKVKNLYTTDLGEIKSRVSDVQMSDIFA